MIRTFLHKHLLQGFLLVTLLATFGCGGQYNTIEQEDPHFGDPYVYGEIGGPPRQTANQYEPDPEADARAVAIREKMFGPVGNPNMELTGEVPAVTEEAPAVSGEAAAE